MTTRVFAAVDLGASNGRVVGGTVDGAQVALDVVHRFPNVAREVDGHLRWDLSGLYEEVLVGLSQLASRYPQVESIGIDTWGVDYGMLDDQGTILAEPIAYRDSRTDGVVEKVHARIEHDELYATTGIQLLPINTIYQLAAEHEGPLWSRASKVVLLPDLIAYWLTGELRTEYTNATTTGLVDARTRDWSSGLLERLEIPRSLLPPIEPPGTVRGSLEAGLRARLGLSHDVVVTTIGSHDTASAVAAVPATDRDFAYVSSGTWSLVGVELNEPVLEAAARDANFSNEGGVANRIRFLRNLGGLWLLQESMRSWQQRGDTQDLAQLLAEAASLPQGGARIDVDDPRFVPSGDMPDRIADATTDGHIPESPAETVRCILDSLAAAYASTAHAAARLAGMDLRVIHVVGGGSQNALLCQQTADRAGVPVLAGPVEATALGNVLVQARVHGALTGSLDYMRTALARHDAPTRYEPRVFG